MSTSTSSSQAKPRFTEEDLKALLARIDQVSTEVERMQWRTGQKLSKEERDREVDKRLRVLDGRPETSLQVQS